MGVSVVLDLGEPVTLRQLLRFLEYVSPDNDLDADMRLTSAEGGPATVLSA